MIKEFEPFFYKGHEVLIYQNNKSWFGSYIMTNSTDRETLKSFYALLTLSEVLAVSKAFIDGLKHVEETKA